MSLPSTELPRGIPRPVEAVLASIGLLLGLPVLLLAALGVGLTSRGPVIFRQHRMGRHGQTFVLFKLRSMRDGARGLQVTSRHDPRITAVGRVIRKTKVDELPSLWNVIKGDLSLVGPRPEVPQYVDLENPLWQRVLSVRPGLTDPVTIRLRNEEELLAQIQEDRETFYREVLQPYKLRGYLDFLQQRSWLADARVLSSTIRAVFFPAEPPAVEEIREAKRNLMKSD